MLSRATQNTASIKLTAIVTSFVPKGRNWTSWSVFLAVSKLLFTSAVIGGLVLWFLSVISVTSLGMHVVIQQDPYTAKLEWTGQFLAYILYQSNKTAGVYLGRAYSTIAALIPNHVGSGVISKPKQQPKRILVQLTVSVWSSLRSRGENLEAWAVLLTICSIFIDHHKMSVLSIIISKSHRATTRQSANFVLLIPEPRYQDREVIL